MGTEASLLQGCTQRWESGGKPECPPASQVGSVETVKAAVILFLLSSLLMNKSLFSFSPVSCSPLSEAVPPLALRLRGLREGQCPILYFPCFSGWGKMLLLYKNGFWSWRWSISVRLEIHWRKKRKKMDTSYCGLQLEIVFPIPWVPVISFPPWSFQYLSAQTSKAQTWVSPNSETQY